MILALEKDRYIEMRRDEFKTSEEMAKAVKEWNNQGFICYTT